MEFSTLRFIYLKKTISFLKTRGTVYLVRFPMCSGMRELENDYIPYFDSLITDLAIRYNVRYFNFVSNPDDYDYTDGNHLYKTSA